MNQKEIRYVFMVNKTDKMGQRAGEPKKNQ